MNTMLNDSSIREKAFFARRKAKIAALNSNVRLDWPDDNRWKELARQHNIQLPNKTTLYTTSKIAKYLHKLGLTGEWFRNWSGHSYNEWIAANKNWSLRALVGIILEELNSGVS